MQVGHLDTRSNWLTEHTSTTRPLEPAMVIFLLLTDPDSPKKQKMAWIYPFISQLEVLVKNNWTNPFVLFNCPMNGSYYRSWTIDAAQSHSVQPDDLWCYTLICVQISWHHGWPHHADYIKISHNAYCISWTKMY